MQSIAVDDAVLLHEISGYCNRGKIQALGGKLRRKFISLCRQLVPKALKGQQYICHPQRRVCLRRGGNGWDFKLLVPEAWCMERLLEKDKAKCVRAHCSQQPPLNLRSKSWFALICKLYTQQSF